jgi:hypothetical protein
LKKPKRLIIETDQIEGLKERLSSGSLSASDKKILSTILDVYVWLYASLEEAKISISRLKSFFGFSKKTEKESCPPEQVEGETMQDESSHGLLVEEAKTAAFGLGSDEVKKKLKIKGHGRLGFEAYTDADTVFCEHKTLKRGDSCPTECGGKLYLVKPGAFVAFKGSSLATATRYVLEKLRCALCGKIYTASLGAGVQKYDPTLKAQLAIGIL